MKTLLRARVVRLALAGMVGAAAVVVSAPAAMAAPPTITFIEAPGSNATITGTVKITVQAKASGGLESTGWKEFRVTLSGPNGFEATVEHTPQELTDTIAMTWSTNGLAEKKGPTTAPVSAYNGIYRIDATATTCRLALNGNLETCEPASASRTGLKVNNAPATPRSVRAELQGTTPVVTWDKNLELDIKGYRVYRSDNGDGNFRIVGAPNSPSFQDPCQDPACPPGVSLSYQVQAMRYSPLTDVIASARSAATSPVVIPGVTLVATPGPEGSPSPDGSPSPEGSPAAASGSPSQPPAPNNNNPQAIPSSTPSKLAPVVAPSTQIARPPKDLGYAPTLPYASSAPPPSDAPPPVAAPSPSQSTTQQAITSDAQRSVSGMARVRYLAGALALLVGAMHVARGGGLLLAMPAGPKRSKAKKSPAKKSPAKK